MTLGAKAAGEASAGADLTALEEAVSELEANAGECSAAQSIDVPIGQNIWISQHTHRRNRAAPDQPV